MNTQAAFTEAKFQNVLTALYTDAKENDPRHRGTLTPDAMKDLAPRERFEKLKDIYMPVDRDFGTLLYGLCRSMKAKTVVEFGTSFGISTMFLAAAMKDNGGGKVITSEFISSKADTAKKNLTNAGLVDQVDFRIGDALKTLAENITTPVDLVLLDGEKSMYLDILKTIEKNLRPGSVIAADNTNHKGVETFLAYVRDPKNGYVTSAMTEGQEITFKL